MNVFTHTSKQTLNGSCAYVWVHQEECTARKCVTGHTVVALLLRDPLALHLKSLNMKVSKDVHRFKTCVRQCVRQNTDYSPHNSINAVVIVSQISLNGSY